MDQKGWATWLQGGEDLGPGHQRHESHPWYFVIWLTGVDYFSTLGYQPGIALLAAGVLSPLATVVLVLVTLLCALPIYSQVAGRSFVGQGSIAMLENLLSGWYGRILVLILLGFAGTDFVITMTLSAADAAQHAVENPYIHHVVRDAKMALTLGLLALLAFIFLNGFKEAIKLATIVCVPYILLNMVVLGRALQEVLHRPELLNNWRQALHSRGDWTGLVVASIIIFPQLALGLSGFETGVSVMPLISGEASDEEAEKPIGRIRNTRRLLVAAALLMSVLLILSSFVTTLLVPPHAYKVGGPANGRAIAYLAHELLGNVMGSIYDVSTIVILWFAGASAMAGLLHLIPRYLPRVGLAPQWVAFERPLVLVLFVINVVVTLVFRADVDKQGGAYATGVLVLMLSAAIAATLSLWHEKRHVLSAYCGVVALIFLYTTIQNIRLRPDGIIIASIFILLILLLSAISRYVRATELRVSGVKYCDVMTDQIWNSLLNNKVNLVPIKTFEPASIAGKIKQLEHFKLEGPLAFVRVQLLDNRSEFLSPVEVSACREGEHYLITVTQAVAIANTIAYISVALQPISILMRLSRLNLMSQSIRYFLMGEGETGLMVYTILLRYWNSMPPDAIRPVILLLSD